MILFFRINRRTPIYLALALAGVFFAGGVFHFDRWREFRNAPTIRGTLLAAGPGQLGLAEGWYRVVGCDLDLDRAQGRMREVVATGGGTRRELFELEIPVSAGAAGSRSAFPVHLISRDPTLLQAARPLLTKPKHDGWKLVAARNVGSHRVRRDIKAYLWKSIPDTPPAQDGTNEGASPPSETRDGAGSATKARESTVLYLDATNPPALGVALLFLGLGILIPGALIVFAVRRLFRTNPHLYYRTLAALGREPPASSY